MHITPCNVGKAALSRTARLLAYGSCLLSVGISLLCIHGFLREARHLGHHAALLASHGVMLQHWRHAAAEAPRGHARMLTQSQDKIRCYLAIA